MEFPKLNDQDDFLLSLQNDNYSRQTIIHYARDLCIFAVFLYFRNVDFMNVSKKDINLFKGYLIAGEHLKDLDRIRDMCKKKVDNTRKNSNEALRGSVRVSKDSSGVITPVDGMFERGDGCENFEDVFLNDVYSKVYGTLGVFSHPSNKAGRKNEGLDPNSINVGY